MNNRREFVKSSLLSFGILPLLNKFNFSNNDSFLIQNSWRKFLPRCDVASKVCENFILQMDRAIKSQTKIIDSIHIHWNNIYDNDRVGIYGYCCSDNHIITGTSIDWLKKYNVSTNLVIDSLCRYYMKNGCNKSEPIIGSKGCKWGVKVYK